MPISYANDIMVSNIVSEQVADILSRDAECTLTEIAYSNGDYLLAGQVEKIKNEFERIKERLLAVCLYVFGYKSSDASDLPNQYSLRLHDLVDSDIGVLRFENSGVIHTKVKDTRLILLPDDFSENQMYLLYNDLLRYYLEEPHGTNWVMDFSILESVPEFFWANITAFNYKMKMKGGNLLLCWLPFNIIPQHNIGQFSESLNLKQIGKYCFSTIKR